MPHYYPSDYYLDKCNDAPDVTVLQKRYGKAQKQYQCDLCKRTIEQGTKYYRTAYIEDGKFYVMRAHSPTGECWDH